NLVSLGCIDKREAAAVVLQGRAVGVLEAVGGEVFSEFLQAFDLEGEVSQVGLDLHRAARWIEAQFDQFLAAGRFQEDQLRAARRFMAAHLFQAKHVLVELHRLLEVVEPITGVKELANALHEATILAEIRNPKPEIRCPAPRPTLSYSFGSRNSGF